MRDRPIDIIRKASWSAILPVLDLDIGVPVLVIEPDDEDDNGLLPAYIESQEVVVDHGVTYSSRQEPRYHLAGWQGHIERPCLRIDLSRSQGMAYAIQLLLKHHISLAFDTPEKLEIYDIKCLLTSWAHDAIEPEQRDRVARAFARWAASRQAA